jgi:hypothetical protein
MKPLDQTTEQEALRTEEQLEVPLAQLSDGELADVSDRGAVRGTLQRSTVSPKDGIPHVPQA